MDYDSIREAIAAACVLFQIIRKDGARDLDYTYPDQNEARMTTYLRKEGVLV